MSVSRRLSVGGAPGGRNAMIRRMRFDFKRFELFDGGKLLVHRRFHCLLPLEIIHDAGEIDKEWEFNNFP
jgi:hypothetical protein